MTTPTTRLAAFCAAVLMTFATVHLAAGHAYPQAPASQLASAQR